MNVLGVNKLLSILYIANKVFGSLRKFSAINLKRQIVDLALK